MSTDDKQALMAELLCIADTKWVLGHWYIKIILNGRTVPDFSSMAGMAQDELGHTRATLNYLEQTQGLPEFQLEFGREADAIHNMQLLDSPPESWADFVVSVYLAEHALWHVLESYIGGSSISVANFCKKFAEEGYFHRLYVDGWLASLSDDEKKAGANSLPGRLQLARQWFAEPANNIVETSGVRTSSLSSCLAAFEKSIEKLADTLGTTITQSPESDAAWDERRRRPAGSAMPPRLWEYVVPTSEAAEMARRPLKVSVEDNIDLFNVKKVKDETAPFFDQ